VATTRGRWTPSYPGARAQFGLNASASDRGIAGKSPRPSVGERAHVGPSWNLLGHRLPRQREDGHGAQRIRHDWLAGDTGGNRGWSTHQTALSIDGHGTVWTHLWPIWSVAGGLAPVGAVSGARVVGRIRSLRSRQRERHSSDAKVRQRTSSRSTQESEVDACGHRTRTRCEQALTVSGSRSYPAASTADHCGLGALCVMVFLLDGSVVSWP
jgi:hypothetical protein